MKHGPLVLALSLPFLLIATASAFPEVAKMNIKFETQADFESGTCDLTIDTTTIPGEVRLAPSVLVEDEIGDGNSSVALSDLVRAKKEFVLGPVEASWAQVITLGEPAKMSVNGHEVEKIVHQTDGGWYHADFPGEWLHAGVNEIIMSGGSIAVEASLRPNRSSLSTEGGRSWDYDRLSPDAALNGEFMCRLRLGQYARAGAINSPIIDLASQAGNSPLAPQVEVSSLSLSHLAQVPQATSIVFALRGGTTPSYSPETWSGWIEPDRFLKESGIPADRLRYLQWRAFLSSDKPSATPVLHSVTLSAEVEVQKAPAGSIEVKDFQNEKIIRSGLDFAYQPPSEKLTFLRTHWPIDWTVHAGKSELERFILLRDWVKHQWKGWEGSCSRPWDAINILSAPADDRGMCVHFAVVFVQTALSLGYTARPVVLNHHFISEVWSNELKKWICMDAGPAGGVDGNRNMHYERDGLLLNTLEVHQTSKNGEIDKASLVASNPADSGPMSDLKDNFVRFFMPMRNNYLDAPEPAEDAHGCNQYRYDGYLFWEDDLTNLRSPEYSMQTARKNDLYWTLNQAELHLQQGAKPGEVLVQIATVTPNFKSFLISVDGGEWKESGAEFTWNLHEGDNTLQAKPINTFGIEGITSSATLSYKP